MVKWKHRDGESNMTQINWKLHSLTLFQPFCINWHWVCSYATMPSKDISLSNQKKSDFEFFIFILEISFDGIFQNWWSQCQLTCYGRFRGCMIKFNRTPKFLGWSLKKIKIDKFFSFLYVQFCFCMNLLEHHQISTKMVPFDLPCLK